MEKKLCKECKIEKQVTNFPVKRKRADGTQKRGNVCKNCLTYIKFKKQRLLAMKYPQKTVFSDHALRRSKLRKIDTSRLTRTLLSVEFSEGEHKRPIPDTPIIVVYEDNPKTRIRTIVTVIVDTSLRVWKST